MKLKIWHLILLAVVLVFTVVIIVYQYSGTTEPQVQDKSSVRANQETQTSSGSQSFVSESARFQSSGRISEDVPGFEINYIDDSMPEDEMLMEQQIAALELLEQEAPEIDEGDERIIAEMTSQLAEFFIDQNNEDSELMDLDCIQVACRVTVMFADQTAQDRALNAIQSQVSWLQKSYAEVQLIPGETSRIAMLLLLRKKSD